ncbi:hypothetical protein ABGB14_49165 [Nonomuraea sp. B10E15]|uniref:hypothetical protein n=1 Tax=Nonomuraea sp. B10E15 TaxID=3153560 RepID=UPI00325CC3CF
MRAAVDDRLVVTELGEHTRKELAEGLPLPITGDLSAAEVLHRIATAPAEEVPELLRRWRIEDLVPGSRRMVDRLPELLRAAAEASPAGRLSVVEVVAERGDAEVLWQAVRDLPLLGPHARWWLDAEVEGDRVWRAVDYALAALDRYGVIDARYVLLDMMGGDLHEGVGGSRHPEAGRLLAVLPRTAPAIPEVPASGAAGAAALFHAAAKLPLISSAASVASGLDEPGKRWLRGHHCGGRLRR